MRVKGQQKQDGDGHEIWTGADAESGRPRSRDLDEPPPGGSAPSLSRGFGRLERMSAETSPKRILAVHLVGVPAIRRPDVLLEGAGMPKLVITHAVVDLERWLAGKAERVTAFSQFATQVTDHVALDGSNTIAITADVHDLAGAQAMMASPPPETAAAMERHGVIQPLTVYIEK